MTDRTPTAPWIEALQAALTRYDAKGHAEQGTVLFALRSGEGIERAAVQITQHEIRVTPFGRALPNRPAALVQGDLADWEAFLEDGGAFDRLRIFGHLPLFSVFRKSARPRGVVNLRSAVKSNATRTRKTRSVRRMAV